MTAAVDGPRWSAHGLPPVAGRFPLSVESHVMNLVDYLVPGVTSVTPHARYYALHALVAHEAERRKLTPEANRDLLRRAEVVLATVSAKHDHGPIRLPKAHGTDRLAPRIESGEIDLHEASQPGSGGYGENVWGFWKPYAASEVSLGILKDTELPAPGRHSDEAAVRAGLGLLLEISQEPRLGVADAAALGDELCVCRGGSAPDGLWLAELLCRSGQDGDPLASPGLRRRETIQLLARQVALHPDKGLTEGFLQDVAFGAFTEDDEIASQLSVAPIWQGLLLRYYYVGAWRRLWSWLVSQIDGFMPAAQLGEDFAYSLPDETVGDFWNRIPATRTAQGYPDSAEPLARYCGDSVPLAELRVLAVGSRRTTELKGNALKAFAGNLNHELSPFWMRGRLEDWRSRPLRDFARELTRVLLARAQRIALAKATSQLDGSLRIPGRVRNRDGHLYTLGPEGAADVGLRLEQLGTVLLGAGILSNSDRKWQITPVGEDLLG